MSLTSKQEKNVSSIIGPNVQVVGTITATGGILIYGKVIGDVNAAGMVRISHGGIVNGTITAKDARISGTLEGDLVASRKVELNNKSVLKGNLKAKILIIEEGAVFEGKCNMDDEKVISTPIETGDENGEESE